MPLISANTRALYRVNRNFSPHIESRTTASRLIWAYQTVIYEVIEVNTKEATVEAEDTQRRDVTASLKVRYVRSRCPHLRSKLNLGLFG
jgi:hypothetical protein